MRSFSLVVMLLIALSAGTTAAAETRGLAVVARDTATGLPSSVELYNKSYAVIIGIDRYQNLPPDRQLQNAVRDAQGVEAVLRKHYRFDRIYALHNEQATKDRIMELLTEELPAQMGPEDSLFLFWAGHGNQEKSAYGDLGYLIPFDGSTDKIRKNLTMAEIRDTISKKLPAKHVFYVMDACYSGLLTSRSVDSKPRRDLAYLKEITRESVRQVLTAGGKNEEALDGGPKGHSVFTGRFIEILENADDFITANELQASIKERVYSDARARNHTQTPGFGPLYGLGDFVFVPLKQDRLGDLSGASAARQKELEQLRKAEAEAAEAKKREQAEIAKKQAELAALDKQIAEMKGRLGSGEARSGDSLDGILAMAREKQAQAERLEELRRQRDAEEKKRQEEIARLKQEADKKRREQARADITKYEEILSSPLDSETKALAWKMLESSYPEIRGVNARNTEQIRVLIGIPTRQMEILDAFDAKLKAGENALKNQRTNDAIKELEAASNLIPGRQEPLVLLSRLYASQKDLGKTTNAIGRLSRTGTLDFAKVFGCYEYSPLLKNPEFSKFLSETFGQHRLVEIRSIVRAHDLSGRYDLVKKGNTWGYRNVYIYQLAGGYDVIQDGEVVNIVLLGWGNDAGHAGSVLFTGRRTGDKLHGTAYTYTADLVSRCAGEVHKQSETTGTIDESGEEISLVYEAAHGVKGAFFDSCAESIEKGTIYMKRYFSD